MTFEKEAMCEQPIYTCKAHVFHIDPKTKRSWMSASSAAVSVSFFYDSSRGLYRIISVEGTKAVINSTITANMTFTKTSQKFGQWSDVRANTVYGLGFASEAELGKFIEQFQEVKEAIARRDAAGGVSNGDSSPVQSATASPLMVGRAPPPLAATPNMAQTGKEEDVTVSMRALSVSSNPPPDGAYAVLGRRSAGGSAVGSDYVTAAPADMDPTMKLRVENDRLKLALAQSSANAKKWELELATLRNNSVRLTAALQESTANVEEWKRQLRVYREEVNRARNNAWAADGDGNETEQLRQRVQQLEAELAQKNEEFQLSKMKSTEQESEVKMAQGELELAQAAHDGQRAVLRALNDQLARQIEGLRSIHHELGMALDT